MTRFAITALAALVAAALVPSVAQAKGPSEASIDGPGLGSPIEIGGGEPGAEMAPAAPVMQLAEGAGFFHAAFGAGYYSDADPTTVDVNPLLAQRPKGTLGPRYVVRYRVPGPEGVDDNLRQELYPYATPRPVSYMPPGQPFFSDMKTAGGWFVGPASLRQMLVAAGLPASAPTAPIADDEGQFPWWLVTVLALLGSLIAAAATAFAVRRPAPTR